MSIHRSAAGGCLAAIALLAADPAGANPYVGTLAKGGTVSIAGTSIKCTYTPAGNLACYVARGGKPDSSAWAATISDKRVQVGKVSASKPSYTSPAQPRAGGTPQSSGGAKQLTAKVGQNFGAVGTHAACSVVSVNGTTGVACTLVDTKGAVAGAYGIVYLPHEVQVRTTAGSKSKVLFDKKF